MAETLAVFGGADREQAHYNDCIVYSSNKPNALFEVCKMTGDIPMERSGHGAVAYGRYLILFGGINFTEETVYNDLYLFDTGL